MAAAGLSLLQTEDSDEEEEDKAAQRSELELHRQRLLDELDSIEQDLDSEAVDEVDQSEAEDEDADVLEG